MDKLGFFIGLVALAISIFTGPVISKYLFWLGIICLVWGGVALLRSYFNFRAAWNLVNGRLPLLAVIEISAKQSSGTDVGQLLLRVSNLARSGQITIFGELGSAKKLIPIPAAFFETHDLAWFAPTRLLGTVDPTKSMSDQDACDRYFNLHVDKSLLQAI